MSGQLNYNASDCKMNTTASAPSQAKKDLCVNKCHAGIDFTVSDSTCSINPYSMVIIMSIMKLNVTFLVTEHCWLLSQIQAGNYWRKWINCKFACFFFTKKVIVELGIHCDFSTKLMSFVKFKIL